MKSTPFQLLVIVSMLFVNNTFSQTFYSTPEPKGSEPLTIKKNDAELEASSLSGTCGYSRAFLQSSELQSLLATSGAVGVRIYNSKEDAEQRNCDIIAVAVDANGKEIGSALTNKYLQAESYDKNTECSSKKLTKSKAATCVSTVANSNLNSQKVFFSKSVLEERLKIGNATGITVIPGEISGASTMMIMAANLDKGTINELEDTYLKSRLPCPTDCGDSGNYLVAPK